MPSSRDCVRPTWNSGGRRKEGKKEASQGKVGLMKSPRCLVSDINVGMEDEEKGMKA
jgi:hypothetical protein